MNFSEQQISPLLAKGEGLNLEFKTCRSQLSRGLYETVCAFLNRHGGTLLLGVRDNGEVQGIDPDAVAQLRKDLVTAVNNPQKLNPPTYLQIDDVQYKGKTLLRVYVPESSQVHRCNGRIYDRNEDADMDVTDHTSAVAALYQRKQDAYSENKVFPHVRPEDLRADLILRKLMLYGAKYGGEAPQLVEGDTFRMTVSVPEFNQTTGRAAALPARGQANDQVTDQVVRLVKSLRGEMKRAEIQGGLGLRHATHFNRRYLQPALAAGLIEMVFPDKPSSSRQRYRLTAQGQRLAGRTPSAGR